MSERTSHQAGILSAYAQDSRSALADVGRINDSLATLSAYVNFTDHGQHRAEATARSAVQSLSGTPPPTVARPLWRSIVASGAERLSELVSRPTEPGERSRAVFVALRDGSDVSVPLAVPIPGLVAVAEHPYVRLLLQAAAKSQRFGVTRVGAGGVTIRELFGGSVRAEWTLPFTDPHAARHLQGPSRPRFAAGRRAQVHGDLLRSRHDTHLQAELADAAEQIATIAHRRSWRTIVVAGSARERAAIVDGLAARSGPPCVHARATDGSDDVGGAVQAVHHEEDRRATECVRELLAATAEGRAVSGAHAVSSAIDDDRATLVVIGAPESGITAALPHGPVLDLGETGENPLETIAWTALAREVPVVSAPPAAGALLPPPHVAAFVTTTRDEGNDAHPH